MQSLKRIRAFKPFIIATTGYLVVVHIALCVLLFPEALHGRPDFRQLYAAGYMTRTGYSTQLYDHDFQYEFQTKLVGPVDMALPFNHLAYEALLFVPLSLFGFRTAYLIFFALNLGLLALCLVLLNPYLMALRKIWSYLSIAIFASFYPVTCSLIQGQDSIIMLTLMVVALACRRKGRDTWSGILVGLTLFKFQFGIPMFFLFLAWKWWRCALGFLASTAIVIGTSVCVVGFHGMRSYVRSLASMSVGLKTAQQQSFYGIHPALMPNLRGFFSVVGGHYVSHVTIQILTLVCSALLLVAAARKASSFALAITVSVLISYHCLIHDAVLLLLPVALVAAESAEKDWRSTRWTLALLAAIIVTPTLLTQVGNSYWLLSIPLSILVLHKSLTTEQDCVILKPPSGSLGAKYVPLHSA